MSNQRITSADAAKAVVRRNTEEVQGGGNFELFEELFAEDFFDHTPQPNTTPDKGGVRIFTIPFVQVLRFHAEIHWRRDGNSTTYKMRIMEPTRNIPGCRADRSKSTLNRRRHASE